MKSIYSTLILLALLIALILVKNQVCSRESNPMPAAPVIAQADPAPTPPTQAVSFSPAVQTALTNVTSRSQSLVERAMVGEMVNNELRYLTAQAKRGSLGPNLPSEDRIFLETGYERRQKELTAQLLTNPPLSQAATELVAAVTAQAQELRKSSPFVGGIHPKIKQLFEQVIGELA